MEVKHGGFTTINYLRMSEKFLPSIFLFDGSHGTVKSLCAGDQACQRVEKETGKDEEEGEDQTLEHPGGESHEDPPPLV